MVCRENCGSNSGAIIIIPSVVSGDDDGKRGVARADKDIHLVLVFITTVELMLLMLGWKWVV